MDKKDWKAWDSVGVSSVMAGMLTIDWKLDCQRTRRDEMGEEKEDGWQAEELYLESINRKLEVGGSAVRLQLE